MCCVLCGGVGGCVCSVFGFVRGVCVWMSGIVCGCGVSSVWCVVSVYEGCVVRCVRVFLV